MIFPDQVGRFRVGLDTEFVLSLIEFGSRQDRQRENVDLVRLLLQSEVETAAESLVVIFRQAVNQIEAEGNASGRELLQFFSHLIFLQAAV